MGGRALRTGLVASVFIRSPEFERAAALAGQIGFTLYHTPVETLEEMAAAIDQHPSAEVMLADFLPDTIDGRSAVGRGNGPTGGLRWVQLTSSGVNYETGSFTWQSTDIAITSASGLPSLAMSQHAAALILQFAHGFGGLADLRATRDWSLSRTFGAQVLFGRTLVILGFGGVGRRLAHIGHALGMRVVAVRRRLDRPQSALYRLPMVAKLDGTNPRAEVWGINRMDEALGIADYVVCTVPLTPTTHQLIGSRELALMRPGAVLINISRGAVLDQAAVGHAVREGQIRGAALDVFEEEPLPPTNELWALPNVVITPHVAGTHDRRSEFNTELFLENLGRYVRGEPLANLVDRADGY